MAATGVVENLQARARDRRDCRVGHFEFVLCDQFLLARPQGSPQPRVRAFTIYVRARMFLNSEDSLKIALRCDGVEIMGFWFKFSGFYRRTAVPGTPMNANRFRWSHLGVISTSR